MPSYVSSTVSPFLSHQFRRTDMFLQRLGHSTFLFLHYHIEILSKVHQLQMGLSLVGGTIRFNLFSTLFILSFRF